MYHDAFLTLGRQRLHIVVQIGRLILAILQHQAAIVRRTHDTVSALLNFPGQELEDIGSTVADVDHPFAWRHRTDLFHRRNPESALAAGATAFGGYALFLGHFGTTMEDLIGQSQDLSAYGSIARLLWHR